MRTAVRLLIFFITTFGSVTFVFGEDVKPTVTLGLKEIITTAVDTSEFLKIKKSSADKNAQTGASLYQSRDHLRIRGLDF